MSNDLGKRRNTNANASLGSTRKARHTATNSTRSTRTFITYGGSSLAAVGRSLAPRCTIWRTTDGDQLTFDLELKRLGRDGDANVAGPVEKGTG